MGGLFQEADKAHGDGQISKSEFVDLIKRPEVKLWLSAMELDTADAENLFDLIDESQDGQISLEELVKGVAKFKGTARQLDLFTKIRAVERQLFQLQCRVNQPFEQQYAVTSR